jgi:hypothetical protein
MVSVEYANAYSEVLGILKFISKEDYEKIPESKIELFKANSNKEYNFVYNPEKTLDEQNVSKRAKAIIGILFRDYWATEVQREKIIRKQKNDRLILEEKKKSLYDVENIFKKRNTSNETQVKEEVTEMTIYKESFITKFLNRIKKLFKKE